MCKRLAVVFAFTLLAGCGKTPPRTPLDEFKALVKQVEEVRSNKEYVQVNANEKYQESLKFIRTLSDEPTRAMLLKNLEDDRIKWKQGYQWMVWTYSKKDLTYDVQKTDSLVSPFVAHLEFTLTESRTGWVTKAQAEADDYYKHLEKVRSYKVRAEYAYQDGKWVRKSVRKQSYDEANAKWDDVSFDETYPDLDKALLP